MKSTHSSVVTTRTDGRIKSGKTATEQSLTDYYSNTRDIDDFPDFPDIPNTSKQHKEDSDMYTDPAERRRRGRGGDLSVSSDSHLQHLTAAAASRPDRDPVQSQAWCGVTRCRADARGVRLRQMTPELEGRGFKRRRGQMTCMPLGSSKGGRGFFKKGVFELCWGVCVFVCVKGGGCQPRN